jgi:hypothetical protein
MLNGAGCSMLRTFRDNKSDPIFNGQAVQLQRGACLRSHNFTDVSGQQTRPIFNGQAVQLQRGACLRSHNLLYNFVCFRLLTAYPHEDFLETKIRQFVKIGHDRFVSHSLIILTIDVVRLVRSADLTRATVRKLLIEFQSGWQSGITIPLTKWHWRISASRATLDHVEQ